MDRINGHFDLSDILYRLIDGVKYIVLVTLIFAVLGAVMYRESVQSGSQEYRAETLLYIVDIGNGELDYGKLQKATELIPDYVSAFNNLGVRKEVIRTLKLPYDEVQLQNKVFIANPEDTHILQVSAYSDDKDEALKIVEAYAEAGSKFIEEKLMISNLSVWEEAHITYAPVIKAADPMAGRIRNAVFGGIAGLFMTCAMIIFIALVDNRVRSPKDLEADAGVAIFGVLTQQKVKNTIVTFSAKKEA